MEALVAPPQEAAPRAKATATIATLGNVLVADAREASEPQLFYFSLRDAPKHMKKQMTKNTSLTYEFLCNDGPHALMGLVDTESDEADTRADEIWDYLDEKCVMENKFQPGTHRSIQYSFTFASC